MAAKLSKRASQTLISSPNPRARSLHFVQTARLDSIRRSLIEREEILLSALAARSSTATRQDSEESSPVRTEFQRDRDRIIHTKSFRRLKHKTQVFIDPSGDHYRTRL